MLSGFWSLRGWGVFVNWFKTENLWQKSGSILQIFIRRTFKTWNTVWKGHVYFIWFWLIFCPFLYCPLGTWAGGGGGFLLNWQNPLSMERYLSTAPKWAIPGNTNKHEWVRWVYATSRGIEEIQSRGLFLGQQQRDLGFRP